MLSKTIRNLRKRGCAKAGAAGPGAGVRVAGAAGARGTHPPEGLTRTVHVRILSSDMRKRTVVEIAADESFPERGTDALRAGSWVVRRVPLVSEGDAVEERANTLTHLGGLAFAAAAAVLLITAGVRTGSLLAVVALGVYGLTLVNLYAASTLYHNATLASLKRLFRLLDHVSIYLLIAGTYTPVLLLFFRGEVRWIVLAVEWGLTLIGTVYKVFFLGRLRLLSVLFYVLMGWIAVALWHQQEIPQAVGLAQMLAAGGLAYTVGLIFYGLKRLRYHHALWHLFVLAGSALHFVGVYRAARLLGVM